MAREVANRRLPVGAEIRPGGVHFRVWAPRRRRVRVVCEGGPTLTLAPDGDGYFAGLAPGLGAGARYRFRLDDDAALYPDPASRFQPEGPHGPSAVVDPAAYAWRDAGWRGIRGPAGQVLYELHVGTFTREGTWAAAARELPALAALGVTALELMPVADFPGRFGWGYDGVNLFAPTRLYGAPDDFRRFVDAAHAAGLGVVLDVVYNHLGPDGNYLKRFSEAYFTDRYENEWGEPVNFDGPDSGPVRDFFVANALHWVEEYHLDGFRFDATQQMFDASDEHILCRIGRAVRERAGDRGLLLVVENEPQDTRLLCAVEEGGQGMDCAWNDDFHHSARVALTGRHEAYYGDYRGTPQELVSLAKRGYLYQGQMYGWQNKRRGRWRRDVPAARFVTYLQNHDQVANSARGDRIAALTSPARLRAMTAYLLLGPGTPLLFQGQEFAASAPFLYFCDHEDELARAVREGRRAFLAQFPSIALPAVSARLDDPGDPATFARCKLDLSERETHAEAYALHRDLLRLRREDPVLRASRERDGAVLGEAAFALRFFDPEGDADRLLVVNLGRSLTLAPLPEPLLAPPPDHAWRMCWDSEDPRYGGLGYPAAEEGAAWRVPAESAALFAAVIRP